MNDKEKPPHQLEAEERIAKELKPLSEVKAAVDNILARLPFLAEKYSRNFKFITEKFGYPEQIAAVSAMRKTLCEEAANAAVLLLQDPFYMSMNLSQEFEHMVMRNLAIREVVILKTKDEPATEKTPPGRLN